MALLMMIASSCGRYIEKTPEILEEAIKIEGAAIAGCEEYLKSVEIYPPGFVPSLDSNNPEDIPNVQRTEDAPILESGTST